MEIGIDNEFREIVKHDTDEVIRGLEKLGGNLIRRSRSYGAVVEIACALLRQSDQLFH